MAWFIAALLIPWVSAVSQTIEPATPETLTMRPEPSLGISGSKARVTRSMPTSFVSMSRSQSSSLHSICRPARIRLPASFSK